MKRRRRFTHRAIEGVALTPLAKQRLVLAGIPGLLAGAYAAVYDHGGDIIADAALDVAARYEVEDGTAWVTVTLTPTPARPRPGMLHAALVDGDGRTLTREPIGETDGADVPVSLRFPVRLS